MLIPGLCIWSDGDPRGAPFDCDLDKVLCGRKHCLDIALAQVRCDYRSFYLLRNGIELFAIDSASAQSLSDTTPLLEEKRNPRSRALVPKREYPFLLHRSCPRTAFAA